MPHGWQRQEGTIKHPYSALNLRLALATFGLVTMAGLTVVSVLYDMRGLAIAAGVIAVIAAVNVAVVQRRRRQRRRREREQGQSNVKHSLFE
jgi:Flp pilus assembly protein TadB